MCTTIKPEHVFHDETVHYFYHPAKPIFLAEDKTSHSWFIYLDKQGQSSDNCKKYPRLLKSQQYTDYNKSINVQYTTS